MHGGASETSVHTVLIKDLEGRHFTIPVPLDAVTTEDLYALVDGHDPVHGTLRRALVEGDTRHLLRRGEDVPLTKATLDQPLVIIRQRELRDKAWAQVVVSTSDGMKQVVVLDASEVAALFGDDRMTVLPLHDSWLNRIALKVYNRLLERGEVPPLRPNETVVGLIESKWRSQMDPCTIEDVVMSGKLVLITASNLKIEVYDYNAMDEEPVEILEDKTLTASGLHRYFDVNPSPKVINVAVPGTTHAIPLPRNDTPLIRFADEDGVVRVFHYIVEPASKAQGPEKLFLGRSYAGSNVEYLDLLPRELEVLEAELDLDEEDTVQAVAVKLLDALEPGNPLAFYSTSADLHGRTTPRQILAGSQLVINTM